ncbi:serine hydrolase domain-containing protein [Paenibacillus sp. NPDC056579]|uniref:serine hydrolase domain-containing protein n=1 Tax=Paenibacillus sp. NPDC056579 TaxID=3345871 RepID=UPI0036AC1A01
MVERNQRERKSSFAGTRPTGRILQRGGLLLMACALAVTAGCGKKPVDQTQTQTKLPEAQSPYSGTEVVQAIQKAKPLDYWPTNGWKTAAPEEHGIDSAGLAAMVDQMKDKNVHSFALVRGGYLLAEGYSRDWDAEKRQSVLSVTKSFTSALTGMLIEDKIIKSVDQRLRDYFPETASDSKKADISIKNVLTMTSGLEWDNTGERSSNEMMESPNWGQYILERNVVTEPGSVFKYSNGNAHLMAVLLQKALGIPLSSFAKSKLLDPMGIKNVTWGQDPQGVLGGAWGLNLTTRDMAKFGLMYLHNGKWENDQIVPASWVETSVQPQTKVTYDNGTTGDYGYLLWLKRIAAGTDTSKQHNVFFAAGSGGQRIFVVPDLNLILAVTADNQKDDFMPEQMLVNTILAVKSDQPLPSSDAAADKLKASLAAFKQTGDQTE